MSTAIQKLKTIDVAMGEDSITLRVGGSKHIRTARVLGREVDGDGIERVWLDRVLLDRTEFDSLSGGWTGTGAVSTVLWRSATSVHGVDLGA
ncbi:MULTISPECIES: hypothetical protein [Stenotrophomonas]|uniref:hypothetical protein n=1 Tax=Stenotrophomonas TaxID=40323 RepID=UPI0021C599F4|nr:MULTISPECIES: hypothetical protein [Stenotrophomonas]MCU1136817.1 hypothetical protein [Stenotrophomonas maltophilia]MEC4339856.1 hypothetical protein [Stenotrophomonas pavanii]